MSFNARLVLMSPKAGRDAAGQPVKGYDDVEEIWADTRASNGAANVNADARTAVVGLPIRIRRRSDVAPGWALRDGAAVYVVLAIPPDSQDRINMVLTCKAVS